MSMALGYGEITGEIVISDARVAAQVRTWLRARDEPFVFERLKCDCHTGVRGEWVFDALEETTAVTILMSYPRVARQPDYDPI